MHFNNITIIFHFQSSWHNLNENTFLFMQIYYIPMIPTAIYAEQLEIYVIDIRYHRIW